MTVLLILVSFIVIVVTTWFIQYYRYDKYLKKFKGPRPLPIFGNALEYGSIADFLPVFQKHNDMYGPIVRTTIGFSPPILMITDTKFLEYLLGTTNIIEKSNDYKYLMRWLGTGLLTSKSAKWKKHRRILTPAFHFKILEQFIEVFDSFSDILVDKLQKEVDKESFDIYPYITLCSLDIICATSMGTNVNAQEDSESKYVKSVKEMCRIVMDRTVSPLKMFDFFFYFSRDYQKEKQALKVLHGYTYGVIASRKKELENISDRDSGNYDDDVGIKKRKTFLDLLLEYKKDGQPITDEDIREEVDTFMFEGHDTTASGMSFILYCIAENPDVQKKVMEEIHSLFGDDRKRCATYRELQEMKYLEAVIKEALRLYPSVPIYARNTNEDFEYDGTIIPKNTTLVAFAYGVHRNPEIYPDPERFNPERFTAEKHSRHPYAYIPFSAGPRNCIGQRFAMLEMKAVVTKVLRNYELFPSNPKRPLSLISETVLKSSTGVHIKLRKRAL